MLGGVDDPLRIQAQQFHDLADDKRAGQIERAHRGQGKRPADKACEEVRQFQLFVLIQSAKRGHEARHAQWSQNIGQTGTGNGNQADRQQASHEQAKCGAQQQRVLAKQSESVSDPLQTGGGGQSAREVFVYGHSAFSRSWRLTRLCRMRAKCSGSFAWVSSPGSGKCRSKRRESQKRSAARRSMVGQASAPARSRDGARDTQRARPGSEPGPAHRRGRCTSH